MIHVCDAIMGTGKSSAAITYMNEHYDQKFIYITPYLDEADRIQKKCPKLNFVQPTNTMKKYDNQKVVHTHHLILEGKNVSTTHASFKNYTPDILEAIREQGYTLIIDENVDVLEQCSTHPDDIKMGVDAGYIREEDGHYNIVNKDYNGYALKEICDLLRSREMVSTETTERDNDYKVKQTLYYWVLPPDLITSFKDVFILTYLFEGQSLYHFMNIYHLDYEYIGISKDDSGTFRFGDYPGYVPDYVTHLDKMIDIYDGDMNDVGNNFTALSVSWFERESNKHDVEELKKNTYNFFRWKDSNTSSLDRMWSTYKEQQTRLRGNGYSSGFVNFNARATNAFANRTCAAYLVNIFMNVNDKKFYYKYGIEVDESKYALSVMLQWIWRSAIRTGERIHLYIPSRRMRELLINWMKETMRGGRRIGKEK